MTFQPITLDQFAPRTRGSRLDTDAADALHALIIAEGGASDGTEYADENEARKAANKAKRLLEASPAFASSGLTARTRVGKVKDSDAIAWILYFAPTEDNGSSKRSRK